MLPLIWVEVRKLMPNSIRNSFWDVKAHGVEIETRYDVRLWDDGKGVDRVIVFRPGELGLARHARTRHTYSNQNKNWAKSSRY